MSDPLEQTQRLVNLRSERKAFERWLMAEKTLHREPATLIPTLWAVWLARAELKL
jgi:hypothetical protein